MPIRIRYSLKIAISSTTAEEKDLANASFEVVTDDFGEGGVRKFTLAASTSDVAIDIGNVSTARFLAIRTNAKDPTLTPGSITIKRNGTGNEAIEILPIGTTKEGHLLMSTDNLTSLFATNPSTVDMEVTVFTSGD